MSTRNLTMVIDRKDAEDHELGFAQNPKNLADNSYVNMYLHHDGYPEWQGVQLAKWIKYWQENPKIGDYHSMGFSDGARVAARLVRDHYYDSCYLYPRPSHIDHNYTYVVWTGKEDNVWISCYDQYISRCVFVLKPNRVIKRYETDMEYTDWSVGDRYKDDLKYRKSA